MAYLTETELAALEIGTRVVFPNGASAYPDFNFAERLEGVVSQKEKDGIWIRLDIHKPELNEWENQIQVWLWNDDNNKSAYDILLITPETFRIDKIDRKGEKLFRVSVADSDDVFNEEIFPTEKGARLWVAQNHPDAVEV